MKYLGFLIKTAVSVITVINGFQNRGFVIKNRGIHYSGFYGYGIPQFPHKNTAVSVIAITSGLLNRGFMIKNRGIHYSGF